MIFSAFSCKIAVAVTADVTGGHRLKGDGNGAADSLHIIEKGYNIMKKVTFEQLEGMKKIAAITDFEQARRAFACLGVEANTAFYTYEEKKIALACRAALYNPAGYGWGGCINEANKRIDRTEVTCTPMLWIDFSVRRLTSDDQKIRMKDGRFFHIEHKSGAGDWYLTKADNLEAALQAYRQERKILVWDTDDFQLVMPVADFLDGLATYGKGAATFFKSKLVYKPGVGKYLLQMQTYTTSKKKIKFLQELAQQGSSWKTLYIMGELD